MTWIRNREVPFLPFSSVPPVELTIALLDRSSALSPEQDLDPFPSSPLAETSSTSIATLKPPSSPYSDSDARTPPVFPLSFPTISTHYLALAFAATSSTGSKSGKKRRKGDLEQVGKSTRLGESSFFDAGSSTTVGSREDVGEEEEEEEEEWDFV
jgi:hypothetical protein